MENAGNHLMQQLQMNSMLFLSKQQQSAGPYGGNRPGVPPASPHSNFIPPPAQQIPPASLLHSRSQPALFSLDSPAPLSPPTTYLSDSDSVSADVSVDDHEAPASSSTSLLPKNPVAAAATSRDSIPTRKVHRRSQSDVPFAFLPPSLSFQATAAPLTAGFLDSAKLSAAGVKAEGWDRGLDTDGPGDDLLNAYMNLQGLDTLTSSEENHENETDSNGKGDAGGLCSIDESKKEKVKGSAAPDPRRATMNSRHCRSLSIDSFMGKFNFEDATDSLPSPGLRLGQSSRVKSLDGAPNTFSLEFGSGHFTAAEMKKIMENEKLVEMALADPKRVKRILANRQSAARSKQRKMRHIAELEHKLQSLQSQTSTMSAQLSLLQRNSAGLANQNNELKFRLQAMEQQAQLKDALNEALNAEVQRLKLAVTAMVASHPSDNLNQQMSIN